LTAPGGAWAGRCCGLVGGTVRPVPAGVDGTGHLGTTCWVRRSVHVRAVRLRILGWGVWHVFRCPGAWTESNPTGNLPTALGRRGSGPHSRGARHIRWGIDSLFTLMDCGLVLYGVMGWCRFHAPRARALRGTCRSYAMRICVIGTLCGRAACTQAPSASRRRRQHRSPSAAQSSNTSQTRGFTARMAGRRFRRGDGHSLGYLDQKCTSRKGRGQKKGDVLF